MSIKNLIDGSYKIDAPIEVENLDIGVNVQVDTGTFNMLSFSFTKIGNICTMKLNNFGFMSTLEMITINLLDPAITPFKPTNFIYNDLNLNINGVSSWAMLRWNPSMNIITITLPSGSSGTYSSSNTEAIIYNIN